MRSLLQLTYSDGGWLLKLFTLIGLGMTKVNEKDEKSITLTFSIGKVNTFVTLAWL